MRLPNHTAPVLLFLLVLTAGASAADWPHPRGPALDGTVTPGILAGGDPGLALAWRVPLGSGYSGIAVSAGRAVTAFTDGKADWVAAFDVAAGTELWRHRLGDATRGHDGSHDGPLSSPAIGGGRVVALGPGGELVALRLVDGTVAWKRQLERELGAVPPHFGFTTTPLVEGDLVVVQAGGAGNRSIVGLDAASGETRWSHGDDKVDYQSPTAMTLAGRRQIVAVGTKHLVGLAPKDGATLWLHALGEDDRTSSASPTFIGEDRFLVPMSGQVVLFRVAAADDELSVTELYRSKTLGNSYAPPVYRQGHVYGFRGQILSCMNAANGERVWRSRPPGGDGLILVDDRLVIFGAKGSVVVADASPDGYLERARIQALDGSGLTWPSFADGRIFVRNFDELAAVTVRRGEAPAVATEGAGHEFGRWIAAVEAAPTAGRAKLVDELLARHSTSPIVEGDFVHFLYRGPANDVAVGGSMNQTETPEPMQRVAGTDLFHRTYRLEPGCRWEYRFQLDFDSWVVDPRNPSTVPAVEGDEPLSEVATQGYRVPSLPPVGPAGGGRIERFELQSAVLGYPKEIQVWLPPGYAESERRYPVLIVHDGPAWLDKGRLAETLDRVVGHTVEPLVVAFVAPFGQWWLEAGGSRSADYARMQVEELLPELERRYRLIAEPAARGVLGNRFYGLAGLYGAFGHPESFGRAAAQSVFVGLGADQELVKMIEKRSNPELRVYLDWNRYDERNIDRDWDFARDSRDLAALLERSGYRVEGGERLDSAGWGGWRNRAAEALEALFPAPTQD